MTLTETPNESRMSKFEDFCEDLFKGDERYDFELLWVKIYSVQGCPDSQVFDDGLPEQYESFVMEVARKIKANQI